MSEEAKLPWRILCDGCYDYFGYPEILEYDVRRISLDGKELDTSEKECFLAVFGDDVYSAALEQIKMEEVYEP